MIKVNQGLSERLHALDDIWAVGSKLPRALQGGIELPATLSKLTEFGLAPNQDVATWFNWHNGIVPEQGLGGYFMRPLDLDTALGEAKKQQIADNDFAGQDPALRCWSETWIPLLKFDWHLIAVDTESGALHYTAPDAATPLKPIAGSLQAAVDLWIECYASGYYVYKAAKDKWTLNPDGPPNEDIRQAISAMLA